MIYSETGSSFGYSYMIAVLGTGALLNKYVSTNSRKYDELKMIRVKH
jgi:hypothetical protein